jgi:hypothetical protein
MPSGDQVGAMTAFLENIDSKALVVGEREDTDWQVAGHITGDIDLASLDGFAHVVGKVSRVLRLGQWQPYLTFPGMDLVPREQRRKAQRTPPAEGHENEYLHGPALMLDILAIYR